MHLLRLAWQHKSTHLDKLIRCPDLHVYRETTKCSEFVIVHLVLSLYFVRNRRTIVVEGHHLQVHSA